MRQKTWGELEKNDVIVVVGRKRIVVGEPRETSPGVVSVQLATRDGHLLGETLTFAHDTVPYWGKATALRK